jgi:hypothetical protein
LKVPSNTLYSFSSHSQGIATATSGGTIYYASVCYGYDGSFSLDPYWKTAQAFAIIAAVFGGVACIASCMAPCVEGCVGSKVLALTFMFTTLCQGLCFLFLKSDACDNVEAVNAELADVDISCGLGWGGNCTIAATVLWFVAGACLCVVKSEPGDDEEPAGEKDDAADEE